MIRQVLVFCFVLLFSVLKWALPEVSIYTRDTRSAAGNPRACSLRHQAPWETDLVIRKWRAEPVITGTRSRLLDRAPELCPQTWPGPGAARDNQQQRGACAPVALEARPPLGPRVCHTAPQPPRLPPPAAPVPGSLLKWEVSTLPTGKA